MRAKISVFLFIESPYCLSGARVYSPTGRSVFPHMGERSSGHLTTARGRRSYPDAYSPAHTLMFPPRVCGPGRAHVAVRRSPGPAGDREFGARELADTGRRRRHRADRGPARRRDGRRAVFGRARFHRPRPGRLHPGPHQRGGLRQGRQPLGVAPREHLHPRRDPPTLARRSAAGARGHRGPLGRRQRRGRRHRVPTRRWRYDPVGVERHPLRGRPRARGPRRRGRRARNLRGHRRRRGRKPLGAATDAGERRGRDRRGRPRSRPPRRRRPHGAPDPGSAPHDQPCRP